MKRLLPLFLALCLLFAGCTQMPQPEKNQYTATFLELFDTVTTVVGREYSQEAFQVKAQAIKEQVEAALPGVTINLQAMTKAERLDKMQNDDYCIFF